MSADKSFVSFSDEAKLLFELEKVENANVTFTIKDTAGKQHELEINVSVMIKNETKTENETATPEDKKTEA